MANFDKLLSSLHADFNLVDTDDKIVVNSVTRTFEFPASFNTTIAFEGDINTQLITFVLPATFEGHSLSNCNNKIIRWKNLTSGIEDVSILQNGSADNEYVWRIPPEAFTTAGFIEISITFYDVYNNIIVFSWNTAANQSLKVEKSQESVSGTTLPSKNEILVIDDETKNIIVPQGYNRIVANRGEKGVSYIYLLIKQYVKNINLLDPNTIIELKYITNEINTDGMDSGRIQLSKYSEQGNDNGLVLIKWELPEELTTSFMVSHFSIALMINGSGKIWISNVLDNLMINDSVYKSTGINVDDSDIYTEYIIDANLLEYN